MVQVITWSNVEADITIIMAASLGHTELRVPLQVMWVISRQGSLIPGRKWAISMTDQYYYLAPLEAARQV